MAASIPPWALRMLVEQTISLTGSGAKHWLKQRAGKKVSVAEARSAPPEVFEEIFAKRRAQLMAQLDEVVKGLKELDRGEATRRSS